MPPNIVTQKKGAELRGGETVKALKYRMIRFNHRQLIYCHVFCIEKSNILSFHYSVGSVDNLPAASKIETSNLRGLDSK